MNLKMAELKRCLEEAGFTDVRTVLASGNAVFNARGKSTAAIERQIVAGMAKHLGRTFDTFVRSVDELSALLASDPYGDFDVPAAAKRVVTFLRTPDQAIGPVPAEMDGARIYALRGREALSAYVPSVNDGPVFMRLIEQTFGKDQTTRTWGTVQKCVRA